MRFCFDAIANSLRLMFQLYESGTYFRSISEVFLEKLERHGSTIVPEYNGMFATTFCDVDSRHRVLTRDCAGNKPVNIYDREGFVAFASELRCFARFQLDADPESLPYYLRFALLPGSDHCVWQNDASAFGRGRPVTVPSPSPSRHRPVSSQAFGNGLDRKLKDSGMGTNFLPLTHACSIWTDTVGD